MAEVCDSSSELLEQTFQYAKTLITAELGEKGGVLANATSMSDVQGQLQKAQEAYQSSRQSKPRQWLFLLSERITMFGNILDVMVQHHPEYVSLAWGLFKFVFTAIVNHQEIITHLSKGLCQIADILPRADLALNLYPTNLMQQSLAQLYSHVLQVLLQAMQWYKLSRRKHAFSSVFRPWALSFKEHFEAIKQDAMRLEKFSDMATKAEMRDTHIELVEAKKKMELLQADNQLLIEIVKLGFNRVEGIISSMHQELLLGLRGEKVMICRIQLEQILSMTWAQYPSETLYFHDYTLTRPAYQMQINWRNGLTETLATLQSNSDTDASKCKIVDILDYIPPRKASTLGVYVDPSSQSVARPIVDILKILVLQVLVKNPQLLGEGGYPLTPGRLREAVHEEDWFRILQRCLRGFSGVPIFIDLSRFESIGSVDQEALTKILDSLELNLGASAKVTVMAPRDWYGLGLASELDRLMGRTA